MLVVDISTMLNVLLVVKEEQKLKKIRIITDSCSDICINNDLGITVLPMKVRFGENEYRDGVDISSKEFYERLIENDELPTTSLISPGAFEEEYLKAEQNGELALVITVSAKLSGTYQSAVLAAADYDNVFVIDSKTVAVGENILVAYAWELADKGIPIEDIVKELETEREKIHLIALLDTLEYLKKGGRISSTTAFVGGALSIKPVVAVKDGAVAMIGKARGSKKGNNYLMEEIQSTGGVDFSRPVCLGYTGLSDGLLKKYIADSRSLWEGHADSLNISHIGPAIGTHVGPGAIAVAYFEATK